MGWFEKKKPDATPNKGERQDDGLRHYYDGHEQQLRKHLVEAHSLTPSLAEAVKMSEKDRIAYAYQIAALYQKQTGKPFASVERKTNAALDVGDTLEDAVEWAIGDLGQAKRFIKAETAKPSVFDGPIETRVEKDPYTEAFDQLYSFLLQKIDFKKPVQPQVSRLMDAAELGKINPYIISTLLGEGITMWEGNEKEIRALIKGALIARLKFDGRI